jgi:hypothetical protein
MTSERQKPVINSLKKLLLKAEVTAAAIRDNAIEENMPIEKDLINSVYEQFGSTEHSEADYEKFTNTCPRCSFEFDNKK